MEGPRFVLLVVIFLFIFFTPDPPSVQHINRTESDRLETEKSQDFIVLNNSTYGQLVREGLNITGFRDQDGYQWGLLHKAQELSKKQHHSANEDDRTSIYQHITGEVRGTFQSMKYAKDKNRHLNITDLDPYGEYFTHQFQRNVSVDSGEIGLTLDDSGRGESARELKASITLYTEDAPGNGWHANLQGVYFNSGSAVLSTSSRKYNSLPALEHFALTKEEFNQSRDVMNATVIRLWDRIRDISLPVVPAPNCELIVWLYQLPITGGSKYISAIESELEIPEGAPIPDPPPMAFSAVVFSPDCGYILEAKLLFGPKSEAYWLLVQRLIFAFSIIVALKIALLKRQMEKCVTPSTRSRIAYHTIGIAAFGDGLILFAMIGLLMINEGSFLLIAAAALLCCIHVAFMEVKFIFDIWTVQIGDPARAQRERQQRRPAAPEGLPVPVTATTTDISPVIMQSDQEIQAPNSSFASLYSRFYFSLVSLMFFSLWAISWPQGLRSIYVNLLATCYFSLWVPQIYRNIMRNCRKALNWEYVIGTSLLRAVPVLYWYLAKDNVIFAETSTSSALVLLAWLCFQVLVLLSQQYLGPRVFVKDSWCPPAYDYHPILYDDLEAGGLPIGEVTSASQGKDKGGKRKVFDCAICMNEIDVPVISKNESSGMSWLEQRNYMVTPCRHIFHTECLEGWMNFRLVCPVCREGLPPL